MRMFTVLFTKNLKHFQLVYTTVYVNKVRIKQLIDSTVIAKIYVKSSDIYVLFQNNVCPTPHFNTFWFLK